VGAGSLASSDQALELIFRPDFLKHKIHSIKFTVFEIVFCIKCKF
jgi:hypothetical protein